MGLEKSIIGLGLCHLRIIFNLNPQVGYLGLGLLILFLLIFQVVCHGSGIVPFTDHFPLDFPVSLSIVSGGL